MKVSLLIQQAYRDAQLLAEEGEDATKVQLNTGTRLLNRILKRISTDGFEIPLITEETLALTQGENTIDLLDWVKLEKVQYLLGETLFNIKLLPLNDYYNNAVLPDSQGIPFIAYPKRTPTGILLRIFLNPSENYTIFIKGYKALNQVLVTDDIDANSVTGFMEDYLSYLLSIDLQIDAQVERISPWLIFKAAQYEQHYKRLKSVRIDVRRDKMGDDGMRDTQAIVSWNLSQGWSP